MNIKWVILAGGSGTRLWPLSREKTPKQFMQIPGNTTLLEKTIDRIKPLIENDNDILIVAPQKYENHLKNYDYPALLEPASNNTAAAIIRSALALKNDVTDPVLACLPADHVIDDEISFRNVLTSAIVHATKSSDIVLLGCFPEKPTSAYGYACVEKNDSPPFFIQKFYEKPSIDHAEELINTKNVYWNSGMYVAKVSVILTQAKQHCPELLTILEDEKKGIVSDVIPAISFDHAVAEKSDCLTLFPVDCGWSDVGRIDEFLDKVGKKSQVIQIDGFGSQASMKSAKPVVLYGVSNVLLIETDDVIFVVDKDQASDMKSLQASIKQNCASLL